MEAIETCRTDALGGRVERCLDCGGELPTIAYANKAAVYDLLFRGSSQALMTIAADPKHLGARIGITAVLHTWGSAMTHHPYVHMIVPDGGLSLDGTAWIRCQRPDFLLPVHVFSRLFRRRHAASPPPMPPAGSRSTANLARLKNARTFATHLAPLRRKDWFVYAKPPASGTSCTCTSHARRTQVERPSTPAIKFLPLVVLERPPPFGRPLSG